MTCNCPCVFAEVPQSLKHLSRLAIRRSIRGQNLARYVPALPLPDVLRQYMLFSAERVVDEEVALKEDLFDYESSEQEEDDDEQDDSEDDDDSDDYDTPDDSDGMWLQNLFYPPALLVLANSVLSSAWTSQQI
jgi:hypothetical protein